MLNDAQCHKMYHFSQCRTYMKASRICTAWLGYPIPSLVGDPLSSTLQKLIIVFGSWCVWTVLSYKMKIGRHVLGLYIKFQLLWLSAWIFANMPQLEFGVKLRFECYPMKRIQLQPKIYTKDKNPFLRRTKRNGIVTLTEFTF